MRSDIYQSLRESPAISHVFYRTKYNYGALRDFYPSHELLNAIEQ